MSGIEPVALEVPLTLLAVAKTYLDTLVWLQLCSPPGAALFFFVCSPPRVRPFCQRSSVRHVADACGAAARGGQRVHGQAGVAAKP